MSPSSSKRRICARLYHSSGQLNRLALARPALRSRDLDFLADLDPRRLKAGSSEIRNWIVVASAAADLDLSWISYTPSYRTPAGTGIGLAFARWG